MPVIAREIPEAPDPSKLVDAAMLKGAWLNAARKDVNAFISYVFLDCQPQTWFHAEWQESCNTQKAHVIFAPLEHGKTEQISYWRTLFLLGTHPELRIWICSATSELAKKVIGQLKQAITLNERLHEVFPHLKQERRPGKQNTWNKTALIIERQNNWRDPSVFATGIMGNSLGSRVDRFIGDDMMNFRNTWFEAQRERSVAWFKGPECIGRWTDQCQAVLINNPWHTKALASICVSEMGFTSTTYEACDDEFGGILWPKNQYQGVTVGFDEERLRQRYEMMGSVEFGRCYRSKMLNASTEWFNMKSMQACLRDDLTLNKRLPRNMLSICGVDPAVSKKKRTNDCVFFHIGVDPATGIKRITQIIIGKMGAVSILKVMLEILRREGDTTFIVEANAQQAYLLQIIRTPEIMKACGATDAEASKLRGSVREFYTTDAKRDPETGISKMNTDFEARTWEVPECREVQRWFGELLDYRPGTHTGDVAMASYFAWVEAERVSSGRSSRSMKTVEQFMDDMDPQSELGDIMGMRF